MGSYPFYQEGRFGTNLVLRSTNEALLSRACNEIRDMVKELGGDPEAHES